MLQVGQYTFKRAETKYEFQQIHSLNHRTFVQEIPQHADTGTGVLVDKFHHKNAYVIVLRDERVVGMVSAHDEPPFSVAERLKDTEVLTRPGTRPLEVRLLAIEPEERNSTMFFGLIWCLYEYAKTNSYTHLFISGVEKRVGLYQRLGFVSLGPAVRSGDASFVPMMLTIGQLPMKIQRVKQMWETHLGRLQPTTEKNSAEPVCLLPGPVTISPAVRAAFHEPPIYHRGPEFTRRFVKIRELLAEMVGAKSVALLNGSGTLGNEAVAATLSAVERLESPSRPRGVMLINGEFGDRLSRQALRFGLQPRQLTWDWGKPWDLDEIDDALANEPPGGWVWGVHQESSTGVLNDLPGLVSIARRREVRVCVDCISSLGAVPLDLRGVYLATGATGKSLGSIAGAAIIFADRNALKSLPQRHVPSYFDIVAALDSEGPCYTFPSATLLALEAALNEYATPERCQATYDRYQELGSYVRQQLRRLDLEPLAPEDFACPVVTTFSPPAKDSSLSFVARCRSWGYAIGGESAYLEHRRLVQIATMGAIELQQFSGLFDHIESYLSKKGLLV